MTNLTEQIETFQKGFREQVPESDLRLVDAVTERLQQSDLLKGTLKKGDQAPDFTLPNHLGESRSLQDMLKESPLVISFYRGGWCPYCNLELAALQKVQSEIEAQGARLIAISPELPNYSLETREKNELTFDVFTDQGNLVAKSFGLEFQLAEELRPLYAGWGLDLPAHAGEDTFKLPLPATYIIDQDGNVQYAFTDTDYTKRAEPSDVVKRLAEL